VNWLRVALVAAVLVFLPRLVEQFEVPKVAAVRVLGFGALAAWLASRPWRWRRPDAIELAVLAWLGVEIAATWFGASPRFSLSGSILQGEGLATSVALAGLLLAARDGLRDTAAFARTADLALAAVALACVYALLQVAGFDPFRWSRTALYGGALVRPFGTLGHPNLLGVAAAAALAWAVALAIERPRRAWWYVPAAALYAVAIGLTFSRAAWLAAAAGAAGVLVLAAARRRGMPLPGRALAAAAIAALAVLALFWFEGWGGLFGARAGEIARGGGETGGTRVEIWRSALAMWRASPWLGHGPDSFDLLFPRHQTAAYWRLEWGGFPFHAHSIYLQTLATRGALGLLAALAVVAAASVAVAKAWRAGDPWRARLVAIVPGLAACAVAGLAGALGVAGAVWVAMSVAAIATPAAEPRPQRAPSGRRAATLGMVVALAMALPCWREIEVSRDIAHARRVQASDPAAAVAAAERAASLGPHAGVALAELARSRLSAGALPAAEAAALAGIAVEPLRGQTWQDLGAVRGTRALAREPAAVAGMDSAYARAIELAPYNALAMAEWARWNIVLGRPDAALPLARRAVELYPDVGVLRSTLASALLRGGEIAAARDEIRRALAGDWQGRDADRRAAEDVLRVLEARLAAER
jgi:O-antigen ligase